MIAVHEGAVFALAFAASAAAPGAEIAALLGRTLSRNLTSCVPLAIGIVAGKLLMLGAAVIGLAALFHTIGPVFVVLQICGGLYLLWLGIKKWRRAGSAVAASDERDARPLADFGVGVAMTMSNPIAIAFYMALLPGVVEISAMGVPDYAVLAAIIVCVMTCVVLGYGLLATLARRAFAGGAAKLWIDRVSGTMFIAASLWVILR